MRIALLGEYSNVHWTLAQGLRKLGHQVVVISDGDTWKEYNRDISLHRKNNTLFESIKYLLKVYKVISSLKGFDVIQIINPTFLRLKPKRILPYYKMLKKHNGIIIMGAFGMDKYWIKAGLDCTTFKYSDFNIGTKVRDNETNRQEYNEWYVGPKGELNDYIANDCDGIVSGLYEYDASYRPYFAEKLQFIPFPLNLEKYQSKVRKAENGVVKFFIGIQKLRSVYKGTDIMLQALMRVKNDFPEMCEVKIAESLPFDEYVKALDESHVILDQLYSYTPAMNALQAMAQGLIVVGGGEEENYEIIQEKKLRPIINVLPTEDSVYTELVKLLEKPELIETLSRQSIEYVHCHHDMTIVAQKYIYFYEKMKRIKQKP